MIEKERQQRDVDCKANAKAISEERGEEVAMFGEEIEGVRFSFGKKFS